MMYRLPLGVVVCIGPQTSECTKSRGFKAFDLLTGNGSLVSFPRRQQSHVPPFSRELLSNSIPLASSSAINFLIAAGSRCPNRLCQSFKFARVPATFAVTSVGIQFNVNSLLFNLAVAIILSSVLI